MEPYCHKVMYYETDRMGITHHSNYLRFMEEARVAFLEQMGWGYDRLERLRVVSPVIGATLSFKKPTTFPDVIEIHVRILSYHGVRLTMAYEMKKRETGELVLTGTTEHCFLNEQGLPMRLARDLPGFDAAIRALMCAGD